MATLTLTSEMAQGGAELAGQGEALEVFLSLKGGGSRRCFLRGCDETGAKVTLKCLVGEEERYADVETRCVRIPEHTAKRCLQAWYRAQRGTGVGRLANRSVEEINIGLWLAHKNRVRREPDGRFASCLVEPMGRR